MPSSPHPLSLDRHLPYVLTFKEIAALRAAIDLLMEMPNPTCFAVVASELHIRTTKRGTEWLNTVDRIEGDTAHPERRVPRPER